MQIGKTTAAHHELARRTARLQRTRDVHETALVVLELVREATLQSLSCMIQTLLGVADPAKQLTRDRARATVESPLQIDNVRHDQFSSSARRGRAQIGDEIADGKIDFMANCRNNWHR